MKVIRDINQLEELALNKSNELIKLVNSEHVATWRHILDVANDDYKLLEIIEQNYEDFVGYGDIMGDLKGIDLFQMYTTSIRDNLNTSSIFGQIVKEYHDLKNDVEIQTETLSKIIRHEILTYAVYGEENGDLLNAIDDKEELIVLLSENYTVKNFVNQTFDRNFVKYEFDNDLLEKLSSDIMNDPEIIELKQELELQNYKSNAYEHN